MEDKKIIKFLWAFLAISILLNLSLFYALGSISLENEDSYNEMNKEWCEIVNQGNIVINILIEQLRDYDEGYEIVPFIEMIECFS